MKTNLKITGRLLIAIIVLCVMTLSNPTNMVVFGLGMSKEQKKVLDQGIYEFDVAETEICQKGAPTSIGGGTNTNIDYAGNQILTTGQLAEIEKNKSTYQAAAQAADIPWQMIAIIHLRETGLKRANPSNGQGIYQFYNRQGGPYPTGAVTDAEFLRQTKLAANFIKTKAQSNYEPNRTLTAQSSPEAIKDTFFGYNGRASVYERQAQALGFSPTTQGYEGSPYVMNKADAKRDPSTATPNTWGQIKTDGGSLSYPANDDYGAYVAYAAIAGITTSGNCATTTTGPTAQKVVAIARQELALWENGSLKPGNDYTKYTGGATGDWCAWFASWVYNQAGYPIDPNAPEGRVGRVGHGRNDATRWGIRMYAEDQPTRFTWHDAAGYTPVPGDLVIQRENGIGHVNIVVGVETKDGNLRITVIGGNQSGSNGYATSKVTQYTFTNSTGSDTTGYITPTQ